MKRFYEVTALVGTLLMSAGLVACGTKAENVTRTDMGQAESTTVMKIQLADEDLAETTETIASETVAVTETLATETDDTAETDENAETTAVVVTTPAPVATTAKATTAKPVATTAKPVATTPKTPTTQQPAVTQQPDSQPDPPAPEPEPEPAPAPDPVNDIPPEPEPLDEPLPTVPPAVAVTGDELTFVYNGQSLTLKQSADAFVSANPPAQEPLEAPSCLGNGTDVNYYYNDFTIYVWKDENGVSQTIGIQIKGAGASTNRGISVGSTVDDVVAAYGSLYTQQGSYYVYNYDDCSLRFTVSNGTVTEIMYDYPM